MSDEREFQLSEDFEPERVRPRRFAPEEMVACAKCERPNPPTRMNCLYCGAGLPVTEANAALRRPALRPLEEWERGFNVVLLPREGDEPDRQIVTDTASMLHMETERFDELVRARNALPVARAASAEEAALIEERLSARGFSVRIISDEELAAETDPPMRVRRLELSDEGIKAWSVGGEPEASSWKTVALVVVGRIFTRRVEVEERRGRTKPGAEVAEARELVSDEGALEIYAGDRRAGWRLMAGNFDYSCLGERKGLLAGENFKTLIDELRARAPGALFDDSYERLRRLLDAAWPPTERKGSGGLKRERPGKFNIEAVTVASNDAQFTRYARLRLRLLEHSREAGNK